MARLTLLLKAIALAALSAGCASTVGHRTTYEWRNLESSEQLLGTSSVSFIQCTPSLDIPDSGAVTEFEFTIVTRGEEYYWLKVVDSAIAYIEDTAGTGLIRLGVYPNVILESARGGSRGVWRCKTYPGEIELMRWRVYLHFLKLPFPEPIKFMHEYGFPKLETSR